MSTNAAVVIQTSSGATLAMPDGRRTDYTSYRGLLCRTWNLGNGQGQHFQEVCGGLSARGNTIPVAADRDVAKIVRREAVALLGYRPQIVTTDAT